MSRLLLLAAIAFILWYFIQQAKNLKEKSPKEAKAALWRIIFFALFGITLALVVTGKAHWLAAAFTALLPLTRNLFGIAIRALPLLKSWQSFGGSQLGPKLKAESLELKVNIANGSLDGTVLKGLYEGQTLSSLNQEQLDKLRAQFQVDDPKATRLLTAYMARRFHSTGGQQYQQASHSTDASAQEAWQILGLEEGASPAEIIKAHKRLIQKLHPDRGGNDYLAAKINAAKDVLIEKA